LIDDLRRLLMWHQKAKGPPDGPPIFLIFVEKLNCPQSQAYQSISPVGTGLSLTDRALGVSLGTSIGNYSPLIAPQPVKLKICCAWQGRGKSTVLFCFFKGNIDQTMHCFDWWNERCM